MVFIKEQFNEKGQQYYILHQYKHSIVAKSTNNQVVFYEKPESISPYVVKGFKQNFHSVKFDTLRFVDKFKQITILHIDSLGIYAYKNLHIDILHLQYSPKINFERVLQRINPKNIILDGSNYSSYIDRWKNTAKKMHIPVHITAKEGAFILK